MFISDRIFPFLASNKCNGDVGDILQNIISDRIFLFLASNKCNGDVGDILQNSNKTLNKLLSKMLSFKSIQEGV